LAMFRYFAEDPKMGQMAGQMPKIERVRLGSRRTYDFNFHLTRDVTVKQMLLDDSIEKTAQAISMDDLPADFKGRIQKRLELLKKSPFPFNMGGNSGPPPQ
jgi:hypothetical protein